MIAWEIVSLLVKLCSSSDETWAAVIEQIRAMQETFSKLLALFESSTADKFVAHLYQTRKQHRLAASVRTRATRPSNAKPSSSCQLAQSLGFKGN
jgi:uncharacterized NAD(P)/FAD-binding protein YdhS